jgi:hypothetical protein
VVIGEDDVLLREGIARLLTEAGSRSSLRPATPTICCGGVSRTVRRS